MGSTLGAGCQDVMEELDGYTLVRGIYDSGTQRFGEEFERNMGSTDNAYIIQPFGEPWVLVGLHDEQFSEDLIDTLGPQRVARIGQVVVQYYDGKQLAALETLVQARSGMSAMRHVEEKPPLLVHCSVPMAKTLKASLSKEALENCRIVEIRKGSELRMGETRSLKFELVQTPLVPEGVVAFDAESGTLFSGKFFSCHAAAEGDASFDAPGLAGWEQFSEEWFHFFDCYFFTERAQKAMRRIFMLANALKGPDVQQLAPMHGPIVREQCWKLMAKYEAWTEAKLQDGAEGVGRETLRFGRCGPSTPRVFARFRHLGPSQIDPARTMPQKDGLQSSSRDCSRKVAPFCATSDLRRDV
ncbi:unnamed protein product [Prorocentrum cordatum]|uniref:Uncharacterized protein n=1 Tax=Prorocentrum cordatum TaxID=2364126 RepID=A0ABN9U0D3_9DINO|nr:unnamed protein product [Polarella glacialis]